MRDSEKADRRATTPTPRVGRKAARQKHGDSGSKARAKRRKDKNGMMAAEERE